MVTKAWAERHFWGRAAFTLTFFIVAGLLYVYYRIFYGALLFPGNPYLSIGLPAFVIALVVSIAVRRVVRAGQFL
jgi:hypothetical protein